MKISIKNSINEDINNQEIESETIFQQNENKNY